MTDDWVYIVIAVNWAFMMWIVSDIAAELRQLNFTAKRLSNTSKD